MPVSNHTMKNARPNGSAFPQTRECQSGDLTDATGRPAETLNSKVLVRKRLTIGLEKITKNSSSLLPQDIAEGQEFLCPTISES